ncbi:MAG: hypothetical protein ACI93R_003947 [Flavobacteriales bacterium]|jgi:hypothetical protein
MLGLFVLEYINNENNARKRHAMRNFVFEGHGIEALSSDDKIC